MFGFKQLIFMLTPKSISIWNMDNTNKFLASGKYWELIGTANSERNKQKG